MSKLKIGLVQTQVSRDLNLNLRHTIEMVEEAAEAGARIVCLQELFRTPYFPQFDGLDASHYAETIPGESTDALSVVASEYGTAIIVPLFERAADGFYNSAAVIDQDGALLPAYRKIHIPHDPLFYEKSYFQPGAEYRIYRTGYARFAVLICYDQWFPEAARSAALGGAQIIFYPTAIGYIRGISADEGDWHEAWETMQRGHAIANGVHVAAVNRAGIEGDLEFWGGSFVCDSFGQVVARAGAGDEVLLADLDLDKNLEVQEGWGFLRNRRPDTYMRLFEIPGKSAAAPHKATASGKMQPRTPLALGYRMPAEWEMHDAIWLAWPHDLDSFPQIKSVERSYVSMIKAISKSEIVNLLVRDEEMLDRVQGMLWDAGIAGIAGIGSGLGSSRVNLRVTDYADVWFRDYGPTFIVNRDAGRLAMVNWIYNAWGGKYCELMGDAKIPCIINRDLGLTCFSPGIVLEGGSIDVNGLGTVLTTEQCLLNPNRNPHKSREELEEILLEYLGARKVIWLKDGIAGDDTDGHVDDIARFVGPRTVLCALEDDKSDENYRTLLQNYEILQASTDQNGRPLKVIKLPMPARVGEDRRLPASYANFYIGNDVVLVPVFGHRNDARALAIIGSVFADRRVVGIDAVDLVHGLGTLHCISQQQPSV